MFRKPRWFAVSLIAVVLCAGCTSPLPNQDPTGQPFPSVVGQSLEKVEVALPQDLLGRSTVILIGYEQEAQFDIDRWLLGLMQTKVDAQLLELPTIPSLAATFASKWIDDGMRSGIPQEDWGVVVTLYGPAAKPVAEFTGTEKGRLARVVVLDERGLVIWFDDKGYSPRKAMQVADLLGVVEN